METYAHQVNERVVDTCAVRQPEGAARAELVKEEKLLVFANGAVIALGGLFQECLVFSELFLFRERDAVDSLQAFPVRVAEEIRCRVLVAGINIASNWAKDGANEP